MMKAALEAFYSAPKSTEPITMAEVEDALYDLWDETGGAKTIIISMETKHLWERKIRIWRRIRIHPRWSNPRIIHAR